MGYPDKSFRLRYVGARFEGGRLPVEVLSDLAAFRDLVVAFAKDEWRRINVDRKRVPKGFDKSIALDLVTIENGSAVPRLDWNRDLAQIYLPGFSDQLEEIVDASFGGIIRLFDDAGAEHFPKTLATDHIRALNRLGSGLHDDERIEFSGTKGRDGAVVYLDTTRRKRLITHVKETYQTRVESVGTLVANAASGSGFIRVATVEFGEIDIPLDPETVVEVFDGNLWADVQFDIQIERDHNDRFRSVVEVFDIGLIDSQIGADLERCRNRLNEIRNLSAGWNEGEGSPIGSAAVDAAVSFLSKRPSLCGAYHIYPTEAGGVLFEFENKGWDISILFGPTGTLELYGVQIDGSEQIEHQEFNEIGESFMAEFDRLIES